MAIDGVMQKQLFYDDINTLHLHASLSSTDAANCYNRVAQAIASMIFQTFGVTEAPTLSMLTAIQQMKFLLWTAYGDLRKCSWFPDTSKNSWLHARQWCIPSRMDGCLHRHPPRSPRPGPRGHLPLPSQWYIKEYFLHPLRRRQ